MKSTSLNTRIFEVGTRSGDRTLSKTHYNKTCHQAILREIPTNKFLFISNI